MSDSAPASPSRLVMPGRSPAIVLPSTGLSVAREHIGAAVPAAVIRPVAYEYEGKTQ